jgi:hypothetical protein
MIEHAERYDLSSTSGERTETANERLHAWCCNLATCSTRLKSLAYAKLGVELRKRWNGRLRRVVGDRRPVTERHGHLPRVLTRPMPKYYALIHSSETSRLAVSRHEAITTPDRSVYDSVRPVRTTGA